MLNVFVAGVPVYPYLVGVIFTIHVPVFLMLIVQVAILFFVILLTAREHVLRAVPSLLIVYVVLGAASNVLVISCFVVGLFVFH